tara:strand:+ start:889 stop:1842 length:954 start_codon:yes stop_codon:yes gene_type:complete
MKKYILIFFIFNVSQVFAHSLSANDRESIDHIHKILSVEDVMANDSQEIWSKLMETEYNKGIQNDYEIEIKYTGKKSNINLIIYQPKNTIPKNAIIDLHGCNGVMGRQTQWARKFISWNYMFVIIDSLRPRGVDTVCQDYYRVPTFQRAVDAHTAKKFIQENYKNINKEFISIFGFSHGATAVLDSLYKSMGNNENPFRNAIAFSPWCSGQYTKINTTYTKLMIITGDRDTWTPAERCEKMLTTNSKNYTLHILKGAYHSFDGMMDIQSVEGHTIGHSQKATNESYIHMKKFLEITEDLIESKKEKSIYENLDIPIN